MTLGLIGAALVGGAAHATEHALIMTIGNYANPEANLPGIDKDAANARRMAQAMGVSNIIELSNSQLTKQGIASAFDKLQQSVKAGDGVFIYYSGHGGQMVAGAASSKKCIDGMVSHELALFEDEQLEKTLQQISARAGRVIMMNDSCFSGGAASTKNLSDAKPKRFNLAGSADAEYVCGQAENMKVTRNLFEAKRRENLLYIAAASNRQVAWAGEQGSLATVAWAQCLAGSGAERSGVMNGEDMRACAQQVVDRDAQGRRQTITLVGDTRLPVSFSNIASTSTAGESVSAAAALESIRTGASSVIGVELQPARTQMRISQPGRPGDLLDFSVRSNTPGYLYIFHVGSDGKTFDLLFPNAQDINNQIGAGTHTFPKPNWAVRAGGPAGTSYLMAVLAEGPRDFASAMTGKAGPFSQSQATAKSSRNLYSEAVGVNRINPGRYGASRVVAMQEVQ